ncbi:MAG: hypothetical protein KKD44_04300 [Proteobacteria bacterium]|nr:hypothetical protein [Pseudomonadota bacterium]
MDYISNHIESVKNLILNIYLKNGSEFCLSVEKDGLYAEIQFIVTVREYFQFYLQFYDSLNQNEKKRYAEKRQTADDVLELVSEYPFQVIMYGRRIGVSLELSNGVKLKPEVIEFMVKHPVLSKPFNPVAAINDILYACGKAPHDEK